MCADCVEHGIHVGHELREIVSKRDLEELTNRELDAILKKYNIFIPGGADRAKRETKIRYILQASKRYGAIFPFDKYSKTPLGIERRINAVGAAITWTLFNNAIRDTARNSFQVEALRWITRPDLSKTGPCPICAPRHGRIYDPILADDMPAHIGCVCEWEIIYTR